MARVLTFSQKFPCDHPRAGQETNFVSQILGSQKIHTIRQGNSRKVGDLFSPRVWSGLPYRSKQVEICGELKIKKIFAIEILKTSEVFIDGKFFCDIGDKGWDQLAKNDGLSSIDMFHWFQKFPFKGQIICWKDDVDYKFNSKQ